MRVKIRPYEESDYKIICEWWRWHDECPPAPGMMISDGTFVITLDDSPVMTLTALYTQSKQIAYLEGFCSKPGLLFSLRNVVSQQLFDHCCQYLKDKGYSRVNILTNKSKLLERYEELGMDHQISGLHSLGRGI